MLSSLTTLHPTNRIPDYEDVQGLAVLIKRHGDQRGSLRNYISVLVSQADLWTAEKKMEEVEAYGQKFKVIPSTMKVDIIVGGHRWSAINAQLLKQEHGTRWPAHVFSKGIKYTHLIIMLSLIHISIR